ncbi:nucleotidyltransferase family protein [Xanthovirga aplysinae]|uniref:nucleotidyltransferase family protein n=1 Tax=Xanthovirga aplysinae TaxID=2529853 RepID=UPI0012BC586F|nr:nucleotidyltransferase family protein [Xanthovirga aplysinae]MTI32881.1 nucleotidyltransferase family protein [Xanthovirga aplysinae]
MENGNSPHISSLLLAAGNSSRMGQSKQLLDINGESLIRKTIKTIQNSNVHDTLVVLGAKASLHKSQINDLGVNKVVHENWKLGIGSSLKFGLKKLQHIHQNLQAVIICVCDQPYLNSFHLNQLIYAHVQLGHKLVASTYQDTFGVPALFHRDYFDQLKKLNDKKGAQTFLRENNSQVFPIRFPGGEFDLDTLLDYENFCNKEEYPDSTNSLKP